MEASRKSEVTVIETEVQELKAEAGQLAVQAGAIVIRDDTSWNLAGELLGKIKGRLKYVNGRFKPLEDAQKAQKKALADLKTEAIGPFEEADGKLRPAWAAYWQKKEDERKAEERRLQAESQKRLEEAAKIQQAEEQKRLDEAALRKAQETGDESVLENVPKAELVIPEAPPVVIEAPKQQGVSARKGTWDFEVVDESKVPDEYKILDRVKIGKVVRALGEQTNISGIRVFQRPPSTIVRG